MVEIGIRELKSRLSYYVQLMQAGETIAIKVRDRVVGFFSRQQPVTSKKRGAVFEARLNRLMDQWRREGRLWGGRRYRNLTVKPVRLSPGPTAAEMIRQMRDEGR